MPPRYDTNRGTEATVHYLRRAAEDYAPVVENTGYSDHAAGRREGRRGGRSAAARVVLKALLVLAVVGIAGAAFLLGRSDTLPAIFGSVVGQPAAPEAAPLAAVAAEQQLAEAPAPAAQADPAPTAATPPIPDVPGLVILIRNAIVSLQQANATGDYSVLREMAAPAFQQANSAASLSEAFADLRDRELDLGAVNVVNPRLYRPPGFDEAGMLRLIGTFAAGATSVDFDLAFQPTGGGWRLFGVAVNPAPAGAAAAKSEVAAPAPKETGTPSVPDAATMVTLIRSSVIALNQANATGNYAVLREISAPGFQEANSFAKLSTAFASLRARQLDLGPVAVIDPHLFRPAAVDKHGMLRLTGFFASRPEQVNFDLAFQRVEGEWRLFGIGLNTSREEPAPQPGASQAGSAVSAPSEASSDAATTGNGEPPQPRLRPPPG